MFHMEPSTQEQQTSTNLVPLFVNLPTPIVSDEDFERAEQQEAA